MKTIFPKKNMHFEAKFSQQTREEVPAKSTEDIVTKHPKLYLCSFYGKAVREVWEASNAWYSNFTSHECFSPQSVKVISEFSGMYMLYRPFKNNIALNFSFCEDWMKKQIQNQGRSTWIRTWEIYQTYYIKKPNLHVN